MRLFITPRHTLLFIGLGSAAALSAAFIAQYAFHFAPCHLCLLQRYPHALVAVIGILGALSCRTRCGISRNREETPQQVRGDNIFILRLSLLACCALLLIGASIAVYHTGVEQRWFPGPGGCTSQSTGRETLEELRAQIMNAPLVTCDQPLGDVFGISLPMWSAAIYTFLTLLAFYGVYCSYRPNRKP